MTNSEEDEIFGIQDQDIVQSASNPTSNDLKKRAVRPFFEVRQIDSFVNPQTIVVETSLERIERKIDALTREVATKDSIIEQTNILLGNQQRLNDELLVKLQTLRSMQENNVAHKRLIRYSTVFLAFFSISFIARIFLNITIVAEFWNNVGLLVSFGFLIMAWALGKDWKREIGGDE